MAKKSKKQPTIADIKVMARDIKEILNRTIEKKITAKEITEMLVYLRNHYESLSYSKKNKTLTVKTENIIGRYDDSEIGQIDIIVELKRIYRSREAHPCVYIKYSDGDYDGLCFGQGFSVALKSVIDGRLDDLVDIAHAVIRNWS